MSTVNNIGPVVNKGDRIRAQWWKAKLVPLAGVQMKFEGTPIDVVGVIRHVRGDHPTNPSTVRIFVDPEGECAAERIQPYGCKCGHGHVEINPEHIIQVLT
jgi:hypothetical protein